MRMRRLNCGASSASSTGTTSRTSTTTSCDGPMFLCRRVAMISSAVFRSRSRRLFPKRGALSSAGSRLLELNVRSFLQARGKVNRGIRDTILSDPGHFLAFNNGISVTAEELGVQRSSDGSLSIRSIKGLQIVNGGQTVASIHRAKNRDKADLSRIAVQAKITVVEPGHQDDLVPFISRYSNTQNKVNETDFSANHPFHVRIQKLSEQIWAPGETSRWFYERARGQWEVARAREGTTPARVRAFDQKAPRKQKVDKTLLAKAVNAWSERPHVVSLGGQKNFVRFMEDVAVRHDVTGRITTSHLGAKLQQPGFRG